MGINLRKRKRKSGREVLYLDITFGDGKRQYEYLKMYLDPTKGKDHNKEVMVRAKAYRNLREIELFHNKLGLPSQRSQYQDFIEFFKRLAQTKHRTWRSVLSHLEEYAGGKLLLTEITPQWIEGLQAHLLETLNPNTSGLYMSKITAALNIAVNRGLVHSNPADKVKGISQVPSQRVFLTEDELRKLATTPLQQSEIKRAFLFATMTGLRLSDVRRLEWDNIKNNSLEIRLRKTKQPEYLPLNPSAMNLLGKRKQPADKVFELPQSDGAIWTHIQKWAKDADLTKHVSFHTSRHTFATLGLTSGIDIYTMSKLLGHTDLKHTQVYAKIVDETKRQAVNKLPSIAFEI